ncbi:metallothionein-like protein 2 [Andrographis paniculata]|uniref:metallothionein-like protein 2 n=1 Tax=Andrographis paniculata TaxID=175694 RepID=UPI0021E9738B|nr:metallothionein-like protein 2 [Andrographis paniculata]
MSCCGGNCGCGAACKCGNGCGGCKMYPDMSYTEASGAAQTVILGVAPQKTHFEESETVGGAVENGCKCGPNCSCNPCTCK